MLKIYFVFFTTFFLLSCEREKPSLPNIKSVVFGLDLLSDINYHRKHYYIRCSKEALNVCESLCGILESENCYEILKEFPAKAIDGEKCWLSRLKDISKLSDDEFLNYRKNIKFNPETDDMRNHPLKTVSVNNGKIFSFGFFVKGIPEKDIVEKLSYQFSGVPFPIKVKRKLMEVVPVGFGNEFQERIIEEIVSSVKSSSALFYILKPESEFLKDGLYIKYLSDDSYMKMCSLHLAEKTEDYRKIVTNKARADFLENEKIQKEKEIKRLENINL
jgi:hypothetical protein